MLNKLDFFQNQRTVLFALAGGSALALAFLAARVVYTDSRSFVFLAWNLFLAWVPVFLAVAAPPLGERRSRYVWLLRWWIASMAVLWLLFFPNAPYILTDLIHLKRRPGVPFLLDAAMLFAFALNGLLLGFVSLYLWHRRWNRALGPVSGWLLVGAILLMSGYGIYIGRVLRFNSWDALLQPLMLGRTLFDDLSLPGRGRLMAGTVACLGSLMLAFYAVVYSLLEFHPERRNPAAK